MTPLRPNDGGPTFYTLGDDARFAHAKAKDAQKRARELVARAAVRGRREGWSVPAMAREMRVAEGTIRRLLAEEDAR